MAKVKTGQKFSVKAETWNSFIDAAEFVKQQQAEVKSSATRKDTKSGVVMMRNNTGSALEQFKVVSVGNLIITPEDNEQEFRNTLPVFEAVNVSSGNLEKPFAILQKPLAKSECGIAMVTEITPVKINISSTSHEYAELSTDGLKSAESGPVRILWKEDGTGIKWAVAQLGVSGKAAAVEYNGPFKVAYVDETLMLLGPDEENGRYVENIIFLGLDKVLVDAQSISGSEGYVYLEITYSNGWQVAVKSGTIPSQTNSKLYHPIAYLKAMEGGAFDITQIQQGIIHFPGRIL